MHLIQPAELPRPSETPKVPVWLGGRGFVGQLKTICNLDASTFLNSREHTGHGVQVELDVAPGVSLKRPAGHRSQPERFTLRCSPGPHSLHSSAVTAAYSDGFEHGAQASAFPIRTLPAAQGEQIGVRSSNASRPAGHGLHSEATKR